MIMTLAAVKILISLTWQAAPPVTMHWILLPRASLYLLKIILLAMASCVLYQKPRFLLISNFSASEWAQKNNFLLVPVSSWPFDMMRSYTFSNSLGTVVNIWGFTSFRLSPIVSRLSA